MYALIRSLLFRLSPEAAHRFSMAMLGTACRIPGLRAVIRWRFRATASHPVRVFGLDFPHPIGLAAGFDKDARYLNALECLGFGFVEIGTVTPRPQPGNARPRLFRLPIDKALINRMGFNNEGAEAAAARLARFKGSLLIGGNIGKNKTTPNEEALSDYLACMKTLYPAVDYFVVNVSSPNTPNLRALQEKEPLLQLLQGLKAYISDQPQAKPLLLKIAPDLSDSQLLDILDIAREVQLDGLVATNTTISRDGLLSPPELVAQMGPGGLSGKPLATRSTEVIRFLHQHSKGSIPIIAVGGVFTAADAAEKLKAGASLVQVYTGFVYEGPAMVKRILKGMYPRPT